MPFWSRDQLPPELRDKDPKEIIEALNKLKELEAKSSEFDKTKSDLETQLNSQKTEAEATRAKLQELEANIANAQQQYQQQQPPQPEQPSIWTDPDRYINQQTLPLQWGTLDARRGIAQLMFEKELGPRDQKIYQKYSKEVDQAMQGFEPARQGNKQNWLNAFHYVKGLHEQDIAKQEAEGTPFFSEPASRGGGEPAMPQEEKLTDEEQEICRRFHWDPEGYLKRKKEGSIHQSERGSFARFPVPQRSRP